LCKCEQVNNKNKLSLKANKVIHRDNKRINVYFLGAKYNNIIKQEGTVTCVRVWFKLQFAEQEHEPWVRSVLFAGEPTSEPQ
jgi:hypothetical protein